MRRSFFTSIELIIIVAVLVVLIGILLPNLYKTKKSALEITCGNHLKQIALANSMYANDYTVFCSYGPAMGPGAMWLGGRNELMNIDLTQGGLLMPYIDNKIDVVICPKWKPYVPDVKSTDGNGYGYNKAYIGTGKVIPGTITNPKDIIMFGDSMNNGASIMTTMGDSLAAFPAIYPPGYMSRMGSMGDGFIHFRHNKKSGVAWVDGHVTFEKMTATADSDLARKHLVGYFGEKNAANYDPNFK